MIHYIKGIRYNLSQWYENIIQTNLVLLNLERKLSAIINSASCQNYLPRNKEYFTRSRN